MAIIDILTHYDAKKKAAHAAKTVKHGVSSSTLSSHLSIMDYIILGNRVYVLLQMFSVGYFHSCYYSRCSNMLIFLYCGSM